MKISRKLELACYEYLIDLNWSKAMQRAGYKKSTAVNSGNKYFEKTEVQAFIDERLAQRVASIECEADDVIRELEYVAFSNVKDVFQSLKDSDGNVGWTVKDLEQMPRSVAASIRELKSLPATSIGPGRLEVKFHNKLAALEALGRYFQLFDKNTTQGIEFHMNMDLGGDEASDSHLQ